MKNKFLNKVLLIVAFLGSFLSMYAGHFKNKVSLGGVGPGDKPTSPIDMYTTILFIIAVSIILGVYFYQKRKNILAK